MGENGPQSHLQAYERDTHVQKERQIEAIDKTQNEIDQLNESNGTTFVQIRIRLFDLFDFCSRGQRRDFDCGEEVQHPEATPVRNEGKTHQEN